jgi:hypothetical protein
MFHSIISFLANIIWAVVIIFQVARQRSTAPFFPPLLALIVFVLPSKTYTRELKKLHNVRNEEKKDLLCIVYSNQVF